MKWLLILAFFSSSVCFARGKAVVGGELERDFKARALGLIRRAQSKGWNRVGHYSFDYLIASINEATVMRLPEGFSAQYESRETASFNCESNVVQLNFKAWEEIKNEWHADRLALHELLSASKACLNDRQYQLTLRIDLMFDNVWDADNILENFYDAEGRLKNRIEQPYGKQNVEVAGGRGGTSGVGGGGDSYDYAIKKKMVVNFINHFPDFKQLNGLAKVPTEIVIYQGAFDLEIKVYKYNHIDGPIQVETAVHNKLTSEKIMRIGLGFNSAPQAVDPNGPSFRLMLEAIDTNLRKYKNPTCQSSQFAKDIRAKASPDRTLLSSVLSCFQ